MTKIFTRTLQFIFTNLTLIWVSYNIVIIIKNRKCQKYVHAKQLLNVPCIYAYFSNSVEQVKEM